MKFVDIEYKNFWAVGNHPIKVNLTNSNTTIVGGMNGAGKSSLLEAITYCYFGKLLSKITLASAINSTNKRKLLVTGTFEKNGDTYKVIRGEKPKVFEIYKNDELIDQSANSRDYQKVLENIIGMDYKTFCQVIVLNKERYVPFMEMKSSQRRQVIDEMLDVGIYSVMDEICKGEISALKKEYSRIERDRDIKKTESDGQLNLYNSILQDIEAANEDNESELAELHSVLEEKRLEEKRIIEQMEALTSSITDEADNKKELNEFNEIGRDFETKIKTNKKHIDFFKNNDVCPTCSQSIDDVITTQKVNEFESNISEVEKMIGEMTEYVISASDRKQEIQQVHEEWSTQRNMLSATQFSINSTKSSIEKILSKKDNVSTEKLNSAQTRYEELQKEHGVLAERLFECGKSLERYESIRTLTKDDGIKLQIIKEYVPLINRKVNEYLNDMEFFINLTLDENFDEKFGSINKENFSFDNLSTGQKCRVNLAIWLALLEVSAIKNRVVSNFLMLDEILEPMDTMGVQLFIKLCKSKLSNRNIFVTTQRYNEFKDAFDDSIKFELVDDFTIMDTSGE